MINGIFIPAGIEILLYVSLWPGKCHKKEYLDLHSLSDFPLTYRLSWMHLCTKKVCLVRVRGPGGRYDIGVGGETEVVSARGRGSGGHGFISGAGETELQLQWQRYTFQSDLIDGSGSISALISGNLAEKMVSMTTEHIFDLTCVEDEFPFVIRMNFRLVQTAEKIIYTIKSYFILYSSVLVTRCRVESKLAAASVMRLS
uniref:Pentatricopeptide n=1 Tax=Solanum tuberosum TaxID=4113 RepID=M1BRX3_SOLTU